MTTRAGLLLAVCAVTAAQAQPPPAIPSVRTSVFVTERQQELRLATAIERLELEPTSADAWVEAARRAAELAISRTEPEDRGAAARQAWDFAEHAARLDSVAVAPRYWMAASAGLLADVEGGRSKIRWADRAWRESSRVLAVDSTHAGAHHIQGRLHAAVMRLNRVLRFLARSLLGGDALEGASWEEAERHLARAAALDASEPGHHLELGVLYRDRDRPADARRALARARALTPRFESDRRLRERAGRLLEDLGCAGESGAVSPPCDVP